MNKKRQALRRRIRKGRGRSGSCNLEQCGLFGFKSLTPLAAVLWQSNSGIRALSTAPTYLEWVDKSKPQKPRQIQDPRGDTEKLHYRVYELLDRVRRPEFLHSATRGRSIVTNAQRHTGAASCVTTDVHTFYESTTTVQVARFFEQDLKMAADLAAKLASICTVHGHLPTGSCLSPLLAYWVNRRMFDRILKMCERVGVTMTLYMDDLTFSGSGANVSFLHRVKRQLHGAGYRSHKDASFAATAPKHITGVVARPGRLQVPNRRLLRIVKGIDELSEAVGEDQQSVARRVAGGIAAASAVSKRTGVGLKLHRARMVGLGKQSSL